MLQDIGGSSSGLTDILKFGIGRWIDQDTQRRVLINDANPYRQTADGRTVSAPGADVPTFQQALQNPVVLIIGAAAVIGLAVWVARG